MFINLLYNSAFKLFDFNPLKEKIYVLKTAVLLKLSYPLMIRGFIALCTWFVFFSLIEQMGEMQLEAAHVVRNLFFLTFIPIFGFGASTRTYVAYYFGKGEYKNIKKAIKKLILLAVVFYLIIFNGALLYPKVLVKLITKNPQIVDTAAQILTIVFWSMLLYAIVNVVYNTISALGKTLLSLFIEVVAISLYLFSTYLVILKWNWSIVNIWYVEFVYFSTLGILSLIYLYFYNKNIKNE